MTPEQRELAVRALDAWDPASGQDLPDEVAVALDADPELRARFDARFVAPTAAQLGEPAAVPDTLPERVLPAPRRPVWPVFALAGGAMLAAVAASTVLMLAGVAGVAARPGTVTVEDHRGPSPSARLEAGKVGKRERRLEVGQNVLLQDPESTSRLKWKSGESVAGNDGPLGFLDRSTSGDGFDDPGVSPFRSTREQPLSTFSIDVDRGSFTWARGQLRAGFLPDPASVRTEEFVNALDYDAPQPESGPFAVQFEGSPSPFSDHELVRITVAARDATIRKPVHLTFLVDTSGSMQGPDRLGLVKESLGLLVDHLTAEDTVAIVTYAGSAGVVLPPTRAADRAKVMAALDRLEAGGSTAMGQGIELAYALAHETRRAGEENRVIIASDGDANVGVVGTGDLSEAIRGYALDGITLTTLGFGQGNYQDARMEQLANDGDGNYYYVDSIEEARHVFVDQLAATLEVVARDVKIQVAWDPAQVAEWRQLGYENRALKAEDFRDDAVDAGEVGAGHTVTALYEITRAPHPAGTTLATVSVRGKPPGEDAASTEWTYRMPVGAMAPSVSESSRDHRMALGMAAFAEHLRRSPYAEAVPLARVEGILQGAVRDGHPEDRELVALVQAARRLEGER